MSAAEQAAGAAMLRQHAARVQALAARPRLRPHPRTQLEWPVLVPRYRFLWDAIERETGRR